MSKLNRRTAVNLLAHLNTSPADVVRPLVADPPPVDADFPDPDRRRDAVRAAHSHVWNEWGQLTDTLTPPAPYDALLWAVGHVGKMVIEYMIRHQPATLPEYAVGPVAAMLLTALNPYMMPPSALDFDRMPYFASATIEDVISLVTMAQIDMRRFRMAYPTTTALSALGRVVALPGFDIEGATVRAMASLHDI